MAGGNRKCTVGTAFGQVRFRSASNGTIYRKMSDDEDSDSDLPEEDILTDSESDDDHPDADSDDGLDVGAVPPLPRPKVRWDPIKKLEECKNRAVQIILAKTSMKKYLSSWGYTRPQKEPGAARKKRRKEDGTYIWEEDVGQYVNQGRGMFRAKPSTNPRGATFTLAVVVCHLLALLTGERPDLLARGAWSPNACGGNPPFAFTLAHYRATPLAAI